MEKQTFTFAPAPEAVPRIRERVVGIAVPFVEVERIPDLRLVISEVVTNAVRHGGDGDMLVAVTPKPGFLCVQVTDTGDGFAPRPRAYEPDEDGGFGLFLVERSRGAGASRARTATRASGSSSTSPAPRQPDARSRGGRRGSAAR